MLLLLPVLVIVVAAVEVGITEVEVVGDMAVIEGGEVVIMTGEGVIIMLEVELGAEVVLMAVIRVLKTVALVKLLPLHPNLMVVMPHHPTLILGCLILELKQFLLLQAIQVDLHRILHHMVLLLLVAMVQAVVPGEVVGVGMMVGMAVVLLEIQVVVMEVLLLRTRLR